MRQLTPNEMAVNRHKIAETLKRLGESLCNPNASYENVCDVMDGLSYAIHCLDEIRHSAFPEWFKRTSNESEEGV